MIQDTNAARQAAEEHHAEDFVTALAKASEDVINLPPQRGMTTRNANRIPKVLAALGELWLANPDLRLGQIMGNAAITYYTEDDKALMGLEQWRDWYRENRRQP